MTRPYILVVDDSLDGREMLAEYLRFRGFATVEVANGDAALTQILAARPALVLMDLQMPGINGWDATQQIKAHPGTRDLIVIALSAHALAPDASLAKAAGCDAFVPKPFDLVALGNAVEEVMQRGRSGLAAIEALSRPQMQETPTRRARKPGLAVNAMPSGRS